MNRTKGRAMSEANDQASIIFTNQKGGVGKTTLTRELGVYLSLTGRRVLLVDCDPQGNLSKSLSCKAGAFGVYEALEGEGGSPQVLDSGIEILSSDARLSALEKRLVGELDGYLRLKDYLSQGQFDAYNYILFDTPPSLGMLTLNALVAARWVIIPMTASQYSMQGTNDLLATVSKVKKTLNPDLDLLGAVLNASDQIPVIARQIRSEIRSGFGSICFETEIGKTIKIEEAIATRLGVMSQAGGQWEKLQRQIANLGVELATRLEGTAGAEV